MYTCKILLKAVVLKMWSVEHWSSPSYFQDSFRVKAIFIETFVHCVSFSYVDIFTHVLKVMVVKTCAVLQRIKDVAPNYIESFYSSSPYTCN